MRVCREYSQNFANLIIKEKEVYQELIDLLIETNIGFAKGAAPQINEQVRVKLSQHGWVIDPIVQKEYKLKINAMKARIGLTVQTGNITRAFYDLLKFQVMNNNNKIDAGILVVPSSDGAKALGSNIANFNRVTKELSLFKQIIPLPCLVLGIDE